MFLVDKYNNIDYILKYDNILNKIIDSFDIYNKFLTDIDYVKSMSATNFSTTILNLEYDKLRYSNFQHLIIYGPPNIGKEYLINKLLENIFGKKNIEVKDVEYTLSGYSNLKTKIIIKQSKHHIVFEPTSNGFDKYLIQEIIQDYAKSKILDILRQSKMFKIIVINKIDNLSYYAQASLRRTLEKYSNICKFILVSDQLSNIIEPLRSRCLLIRMPLLNENEIFNNLLTIKLKEKLNISLHDLLKITNKSDNKFNHSLWLLEMMLNNINYNTNWESIIDNIVDLILSFKIKDNNEFISKKKINILLNLVKKIRDKFYILFITNIQIHVIIEKIMIKLINKINNIKLKYNIINITSIYENRLNQGTRQIIHIEIYIIKLIFLLNNKNS